MSPTRWEESRTDRRFRRLELVFPRTQEELPQAAFFIQPVDLSHQCQERRQESWKRHRSMPDNAHWSRLWRNKERLIWLVSPKQSILTRHVSNFLRCTKDKVCSKGGKGREDGYRVRDKSYCIGWEFGVRRHIMATMIEGNYSWTRMNMGQSSCRGLQSVMLYS